MPISWPIPAATTFALTFAPVDPIVQADRLSPLPLNRLFRMVTFARPRSSTPCEAPKLQMLLLQIQLAEVRPAATVPHIARPSAIRHWLSMFSAPVARRSARSR